MLAVKVELSVSVSGIELLFFISREQASKLLVTVKDREAEAVISDKKTMMGLAAPCDIEHK